MKNIVITGIGVVSPIGIGRDEFYKNLQTKHEIGQHTGRVKDLNAAELLGAKGLKYLDNFTIHTLCAAKFAIDDSGYIIRESNQSRIGVILGILSTIKSAHEFNKTKLIEGCRFVEPMQFPNTVMNAPASHISIKFGITGLNITIANGATSGLDAVINAIDMIEDNVVDIVYAGAAEEFCEETYIAMMKSGFLTNGSIFSEGAYILAVEDMNSAVSRNAKVYAQIKGYGMAFGNKACVRAKRFALEAAQMKEDELDAEFRDIDSYDILGRTYCTSGAFNLVRATLLLKDSAKNILVNSLGCKGQATSIVISKL